MQIILLVKLHGCKCDYTWRAENFADLIISNITAMERIIISAIAVCGLFYQRASPDKPKCKQQQTLGIYIYPLLFAFI